MADYVDGVHSKIRERDSVSDFGFQFTREAVQCSCNFDLVELVDVVYCESGYVTSKTVSIKTWKSISLCV